MNKLPISLSAAIGMTFFSALAAETPKPKYGPMATRLADSHEYVQKHAAPDYWALSSYYLSQQWGGACSLAGIAMVVNASRVHAKLTADDMLATQSKLLEKVKEPLVDGKTWAVAVGAEGKNPSGATLEQAAVLLQKSLEAYGVKVKRVEVFHVDSTDAKTKAKIHAALAQNEKSDSDFILANFNQQAYTGDADVGHFAPVAAYDAQKKRVLIFDPDREYYEPYWVSEETFIAGMATKDSGGKANRGYLWVETQR